MNLKKAFFLYCNVNSPKHFGLTHQRLGMDQKHFRMFVKMTRLIGGGLKDNDVSIIFVEACYIGILFTITITILIIIVIIIIIRNKGVL